MHSLTLLLLPLLAPLLPLVSAHGYVQSVSAQGTSYPGYNPSFQYHSPIPLAAGWSAPEDIDNGFIDPTKYSDPNIICHRSATPAGLAVSVTAGEIVEVQWNTWPESHHGPVLDYLARCPDAEEGCGGVDKTELEFVKIGEKGMLEWDVMPGKWASDELISANNTWSILIPATLKSGPYVLRHEIISLHSANNHNGAQNYPQCITVNVTAASSEGGGTEDLSKAGGIPATEFYTNEDPGIAVNIYESQSGYVIPGPTVWSGATKQAGETTGGSGYTTSLTGSSPLAYASSTMEMTSASSYDGDKTSTAAPTTTTSTSSTCSSTTTTTNTPTGPSPYSKIQALIDSLPSEALTQTIAVPTTTATPASYDDSEKDESSWDGKPAKELPEGWTLKNLLEWVQWEMKEAWAGRKGGSGNGRRGGREGRHSRDFR